MFPTRPPDAPAGEAPIIAAHNPAGPDGEEGVEPTEGQRRRLVPPPAQAPPSHRPLGLQLDLVDVGMAPADRLRAFSVAVVVT